jgi:hypothetical protein
MGEKKTLHVVSWSAYKSIHPEETIDDYKKLVIHELAHLKGLEPPGHLAQTASLLSR